MSEDAHDAVHGDPLTEVALAPAAVARLLDDAAASADGLWDLERAVLDFCHKATEAGVADDAPGVLLLRAAADAITYRLSFDGGRCTFEPHLLLVDETRPLRVEQQPADVTDGWLTLSGLVTHAVWRSRLCHLLTGTDRYVGRGKVDAAAEAISAYLATPTALSQGLDRVDALHAALSLARQFGLRDARTEVYAALVASARRAVADEPQAAGIVLGLTQILVDDRDAPAETDDVLDAARTAYAGDAHRTDDVIEQQLERAADDARRSELWRQRVRAWLDAAAATNDVRRAHFLQVAVQHALSAGDPALREEATARLQQLTIEYLGLRGIRTGIILRGEEIAHAVRPVTDAANWADALDAFAMLGPPTGDVDVNRKVVDEHAKQFVLSSLFPVVLYGSDGLPRWQANNEAERREHELARQESMQLQFQRRLVAEALMRFPVHHPIPSHEELTAYFGRNRLVDQALAASLARAFLRWWAGDYEGAAFTVTPRIETLVRNLLLAVNAPLYRLQREQSPGQYPGLGFLLAQLQKRHGLPESWYRYLYTFLANPAAGWNVRNELLHGFLDDVDLITASLLLQCAASLTLLEPSATATASAPTDDGSIA